MDVQVVAGAHCRSGSAVPLHRYVRCIRAEELHRLRQRLPRLDARSDRLVGELLDDLLARLLLARADRLARQDPATLARAIRLFDGADGMRR